MKILGAIIAGGRSSRMGGREKAFLDLGGVPLLERVWSRIRFQVHDVIINANGDGSRFARFGLPVIADTVHTVQTPLAGLHAALTYAVTENFDAVLTVPTDSPFLPLDLVDRLEEEGRATGAAVAMSDGQVHYLTGLWSTALAPVLDEAIRSDGLVRVQDFERRVHTEEVVWATAPHDPFLNINTPEDLAAAAAHIHE
jgi:molybdenum cofactor guanylyltransferase